MHALSVLLKLHVILNGYRVNWGALSTSVDMRFIARNIIAQALSIGFLIVVLFAAPGNTSEASLRNIEVSNTDDHLLVYFTIVDCFTEDMKKAINSGIETTFNFLIRVYEVRGLLWDKKIAELKVKHAVQYDSLKKVYMVRLVERSDEIIFVNDFEGVNRHMSVISGLRIVDLQKLVTDSHYQVRMMVELDEIRLPFYLHHVFFFLSLWDFETDWYSVDFIY